MKKVLSNIFTTIGFSLIILGLIFHSFPSQSYAEDLELIGKDIGLVVEPADTRLFDLSNLNPGDTKTAKLTIKNSYTKPFNLYMRAERMGELQGEGEADLFDILTITVTLKGVEIYRGPIKDFAKSSIFLGKFSPVDIRELVATVHLPGPETGNEYQGKTAEVKWIFIAESSSPPPDKDDEPDRPDEPIDIPDKEVPKGEPKKPEIPKEEPETPVEEPEQTVEPEETEIIEEEVPKGEPKPPKTKAKLPKTGETPLQLFYISGTIMVALGLYMNKKSKK